MSTETSYTQISRTDCFLCGKGNCTKKCGGCNVARYCSRKCQEAHWKSHKSGCVIDSKFKAPKTERRLFKDFNDKCRHGGKAPSEIVGFQSNINMHNYYACITLMLIYLYFYINRCYCISSRAVRCSVPLLPGGQTGNCLIERRSC